MFQGGHHPNVLQWYQTQAGNDFRQRQGRRACRQGPALHARQFLQRDPRLRLARLINPLGGTVVPNASWPDLAHIGVKIAVPVASPSWPGSSGPCVAACAGGDGPDEPGHDEIATIVSPARYFNTNGAWPGHPRLAVPIASKSWLAGTRPAMTRGKPVPLN